VLDCPHSPIPPHDGVACARTGPVRVGAAHHEGRLAVHLLPDQAEPGDDVVLILLVDHALSASPVPDEARLQPRMIFSRRARGGRPHHLPQAAPCRRGRSSEAVMVAKR
jgi:hypothetical protein